MLNLNTKIAEKFVDHAIDISRLDADLRRRVLGFLKELEVDLIKKLQSIDLTERAKKRTEALFLQTKTMIDSTVKAIAKESEDFLQDAAFVNAEITRNIVNSAAGVEIMSVGLSKNQIMSLSSKVLIEGAPSKDWWTGNKKLGTPGFGGKLQLDFIREMRTGIAQGETTNQLVQRLRGKRTNKTEILVYKTKLKRVPVFQGGLMDLATRNAEAVVRTSVQTVLNDARLAVFSANPDVISGIEWLSTLDTRTTPICRALDGLTWDNDRNPIGHDFAFPGPTAHWNCRSTQIPVISDFETIPKAKQKAVEKAGERASMDGAVSGKITYEKWFEKQTVKRKIEILGQKKYALYEEGNLSFTDMVDMRKNPLTIEELKAKYGL